MKKWEIDEDVDAVFRDLDTNHDDQVTWLEFMTRTYGFQEEGTQRMVNNGNVFT